MRRLVWFATGAASGVYTLVKARRAARNLTPDGIGARVAAVGLGARMFADEVAASMATREAELRAELGLAVSPRRVIGPAATRGLTPAAPVDHAADMSSPGNQDREGTDDGDR